MYGKAKKFKSFKSTQRGLKEVIKVQDSKVFLISLIYPALFEPTHGKLCFLCM